ncbi:UNKNOWN [Stylonychia lemnae]|uniref:Uncharacterized protein n=1 Tax=Stylonychia lemnae TaxID=5949 RepID=A0A078B9S1_STYLE|nr:UNKNOWN [Stylonychia lemnae]|eukprot:CDW90941.1 UNKNOWN [Stylonychia lemnae]
MKIDSENSTKQFSDSLNVQRNQSLKQQQIFDYGANKQASNSVKVDKIEVLDLSYNKQLNSKSKQGTQISPDKQPQPHSGDNKLITERNLNIPQIQENTTQNEMIQNQQQQKQDEQSLSNDNDQPLLVQKNQRKLQSQHESLERAEFEQIRDQVKDEEYRRNQTEKTKDQIMNEIYIRPQDVEKNNRQIVESQTEEIMIVDKGGELDPITPLISQQNGYHENLLKASLQSNGQIIDTDQILKNQGAHHLYIEQDRILREQQQLYQQQLLIKTKDGNNKGGFNAQNQQFNLNYEQMGEYYKQRKQQKSINKREQKIDDAMEQILAKAFLDNLATQNQPTKNQYPNGNQKPSFFSESIVKGNIKEGMSKKNGDQNVLIDLNKFNLVTESELSMSHQNSFVGNQVILSHDRFLQDPNSWGLMFQDTNAFNNDQIHSPFQEFSRQQHLAEHHHEPIDEKQYELDLQKAIVMSQKENKGKSSNQRNLIIDSSLQKAQDQNLKEFIDEQNIKVSQYREQLPLPKQLVGVKTQQSQNNQQHNHNHLQDSHAQYYAGSLNVSPVKNVEPNNTGRRDQLKLGEIQIQLLDTEQKGSSRQAQSTPQSTQSLSQLQNSLQNKAITLKVAQHLREEDSPRMNDVDDNQTDPNIAQLDASNLNKIDEKKLSISEDTNPSSNNQDEKGKDQFDLNRNIIDNEQQSNQKGKGILKNKAKQKKNNGCCHIY